VIVGWDDYRAPGAGRWIADESPVGERLRGAAARKLRSQRSGEWAVPRVPSAERHLDRRIAAVTARPPSRLPLERRDRADPDPEHAEELGHLAGSRHERRSDRHRHQDPTGPSTASHHLDGGCRHEDPLEYLVQLGADLSAVNGNLPYTLDMTADGKTILGITPASASWIAHLPSAQPGTPPRARLRRAAGPGAHEAVKPAAGAGRLSLSSSSVGYQVQSEGSRREPGSFFTSRSHFHAIKEVPSALQRSQRSCSTTRHRHGARGRGDVHA